MTTAPRPRSDSRRNREAILAAGLRLLSRDPDAALADVARDSGVSRQTVHAHFATREDLLEALVSRAIAHTADAIDQASPGEGAAAAALVRVAAASWQQLSAHTSLLDSATRALGPRLHELHAPVRDRVEALLRRGRRAGEFTNRVPVEWQADTYFALVHAAGRATATGRETPKRAEKHLIATLLAALAATPD